MTAQPKQKASHSMVNAAKVAIATVVGMSLAACEKGDRSYSLLADAESFQQTATYTPRKVDVLWIIDNSYSMATSQQNLTDNFGSFINRFTSLNYDFQMGVNATDAWLGRYNTNYLSYRRLRDGAGSNHSNVFVMDKDTPDKQGTFVINATQGVSGSGDERAFQSIEDTLNHAANDDFGRDEAFLAIIIVSDEDDFSANQYGAIGNNYNHANIIPVSYYKDYLDGKKGAGNYSVSAITITDAACLAQVNQNGGRLIGNRYMQLAAMTGGTSNSLCGDFGTSLQMISNQIISVSSSFVLDRAPVESSIKVTVDGVSVPADSIDGWTYTASTLTLTFHGTSVPSAGAAVQIKFDPAAPKN